MSEEITVNSGRVKSSINQSLQPTNSTALHSTQGCGTNGNIFGELLILLFPLSEIH